MLSLFLLTLAAASTGGIATTLQPAPRRADSVSLLIVGTTDVHGRIRGWNYETNRADPVRGLARAATVVDSVRRSAPGRVVLLDAGDLLQGNSFTYVAARVAPAGTPHPVIAAMNAMHYDASAVGNHEFNYGVPFLDAAIGQAHFPFLATNAYRPNGARAFKGWTVIERQGVRVGIIGATTPGSMLWDKDNLKGRVVVRDIVPEVRAAVGEVRKAGVDVVVLTVHSGLGEPSSYDTLHTGVPSENVAARVAREVSGVDLVLYGHSHKEMPDTVINGVLLMQPKNWAQSVGVAELKLLGTTGHWRITSKQSRVIQCAGEPENAAVLAATDSAHRLTVRWVTTPIGRTAVRWRADSSRVVDTPLLDFVLEVERHATGAELASTAAFSLDATLDSGAVTAARIQALYPYDNTLRVVKISGQQLRGYLEQSARYYITAPDGSVSVDPAIPGFNFDVVAGVDYTLDLSKPIGQRVTRLERKGRVVAPTDSFTMALNNYRQTGGGGYAMLAGAPVVYDHQEEIRQLLIDEVRRKGTINPSDYFTPNWHIEPASAVSSLYAQLRRESREDSHAAGTPPVAPARAPAARLRIVGINDLHGGLEPRPDVNGVRRGGVAYLATAIKRAQAGCVAPACESIFLDAGDEFQGTPASNMAFGRPVVQIFNLLGLAASAVGNHEFDWGQDTLRARMRDAHYDMLAANVRYADGRDVPWLRDDTLITRGAVKVGVIGVATRLTATTTKASNVADLRFVEPAPIVDSLARDLRRRGADYVVVVAHAGAFCDRDGATNCNGEIIDLARNLHEHIDAIVSGHTHSLVDASVNGMAVEQARSSGTAFEVIDLGPGDATHHVYDVLPDSLPPDPQVAALVSDAVARVAPLVNRPIATLTTDLNRSGPQYPLGNLIADAIRAAGKGDVGVVNNGGIRSNLRAGTLTYGSLFEVAPFGNVLYRITANGKALRTYFERIVSRRVSSHLSGVHITYDSTRAPGARIVSVRFTDGRELRDDGTYTIIMTDFLATTGEGLELSNNGIRTDPLNIVDLDAILDYVHALPQPIAAPTDSRIVVAGAAL